MREAASLDGASKNTGDPVRGDVSGSDIAPPSMASCPPVAVGLGSAMAGSGGGVTLGRRTWSPGWWVNALVPIAHADMEASAIPEMVVGPPPSGTPR